MAAESVLLIPQSGSIVYRRPSEYMSFEYTQHMDELLREHVLRQRVLEKDYKPIRYREPLPSEIEKWHSNQLHHDGNELAGDLMCLDPE